MRNEVSEWFMKRRLQSYAEEWGQQLWTIRKMIFILFFLATVLEIVMFFVLQATGMLEHTPARYLLRYVIRPFIINSVIITIGTLVSRVTTKSLWRERVHLMVITLMIGNIANVHNVFMVLLFLFMVPVFITVVFQSISTLITALSEILILCISFRSYCSDSGAASDGYFIPSILLMMILLLACRYLAGVLIRILKEKTNALMQMTKEAEEAKIKAEHSNRSKSEFLSNMSHEIRTPINAVLGMDEMILRESTEPEIVEYAQNIQGAGKALLGLVNDILDLSKIESGKMELIPVDYEMGSMINDLVNMISARANDKGLSFLVEVDREIPHVLHGDEIRLKQVVMNLLTNAVKYTDKGTVTMQIGYRVRDERRIALSFTVRDTGKGMKKEDMAKLFSPFERIEEEKNRSVEGTGLGMSITKQLLSMMESELKVESEYGKGSCFSFEVTQPVQSWTPVGDYTKAYHNARKEHKRYKSKFIAMDARLLVVDDVSVNLKVFTGLLKKTEMQIDTALSGEEGLLLAAQQKYDMIFIDHMMPKMDGIEMLHQLQQETYAINKDTPKIALTANAISGVREQYIKAGFREYLTKPIDVSKLESMIVRFLPKEKVLLTEEEEA